MRTRILKTITLTSGCKVMHLKNDNCKVTRIQFCESIAHVKKEK